MRCNGWRGSALGMAFVLGLVGTAAAQTPTPPKTIWNYFGIPQDWNACKDSRLNRLGNNPERERVPPLKRIADPENLESPNPAIKTAAKIKAESDLVPQKIKAIKYLGTIACCCPANKDKIKGALLAALSDCHAGVRQAAAEAICYAAGNPCSVCNACSCCGADVMNKLAEMAEGKTPSGCWIEPSQAVRTAAANALASCKNVHRPTVAGEAPGVEPMPREQRTPTPAPPPPAVPPREAGSLDQKAAPSARTPALLDPPPATARPTSTPVKHAAASAAPVDATASRPGESEPAGYAEAMSDLQDGPALRSANATSLPKAESREIQPLPVSFGPEIQPLSRKRRP